MAGKTVLASDQDILNVFDDPRYANLAIQKRGVYAKNRPYPHIYFDNFLPPEVVDRVSREYADPKCFDDSWKFHNNNNVRRYFLDDSTKFTHSLKLFAAALNSRSFLLFLETLTGVEAVLPDPYFMGGGAMLTGTGGFLKIHADFNYHHKLQAWRRLNALFYLTPNWNRDWGGALELWSTDKQKKVQIIDPEFNRVVIFSTTSDSYHGQPDPIRCPREEYRRVFSAFYYSSQRGERIDSEPHFTKYSIDNSPYSKKIGEDYRRKGG